jgi:hypothetical protein
MLLLHNFHDIQHKCKNVAENSDQNYHNLKLRNRMALNHQQTSYECASETYIYKI